MYLTPLTMIIETFRAMKLHVLLLVVFPWAICRDNLYEFTLKILNLSIQTGDCVKFLCDADFECNFVKGAVMELNIPAMDATTIIVNKEFFLCSHYYLIVSSNLTKLKELFWRSTDLDKMELRTHSRILIFYQGNGDLNQEEFTIAAHRYGYDVLVVQNFKVYDRVIFYSNEKTSLQKLKAVSLRRMDTLASLDNDTMIFHKELFELSDWKPIFNNWTFDVAVADCSPFVIKSHKEFYGIDIEVVETVTKSWPTKYVEYNMTVPYGTMQADLLANKIDLAVCSQWRESVWVAGLGISFPYSQHCTTFLVPKPYIDQTISYTFKPIQTECWVIIGATVFILALLVSCYARIYLSLKRESSYLNYVNSVVDIYKILWMNCPKFPPATFVVYRIILNNWCLTAMLITTSYSAGYTTVLTHPKLTKSINTFEDMVNQDIHWGGMGNYIRETVSMSLKPEINQMYKNYFNDCTIDCINRRIRVQKDFAVFVKALPEKYITDIDHLDDVAKRSLKVLPQCTRVNFPVFAFTRNSPFPKLFDKYIMVFLECGLIRAWFTRNRHMDFKSMVHFYTIYGQANHTAVPLNMKKLEGAFHLLGIGLGLSLIVLIFEMMYYNIFASKFLGRWVLLA